MLHENNSEKYGNWNINWSVEKNSSSSVGNIPNNKINCDQIVSENNIRVQRK